MCSTECLGKKFFSKQIYTYIPKSENDVRLYATLERCEPHRSCLWELSVLVDNMNNVNDQIFCCNGVYICRNLFIFLAEDLQFLPC